MSKFLAGYLFLFLSTVISFNTSAQNKRITLGKTIDSLIVATSFSGVVYIVQGKKPLYEKATGYADAVCKKPVRMDSRTLVGSVSKQMTAVLVLQLAEKSKIDLQAKVGKYLPELQQDWKDSVTLHQLLTHTHGIPEDGSLQLLFTPGTQFQYSQIGYSLLGKIIEKITGQTLEQKITALFRYCGMKHSAYPSPQELNNVVKGYVAGKEKMEMLEPQQSLEGITIAGGGLVSTVADLVTWNQMLHSGKLLSKPYYELMITPQPAAVRKHPIFGITLYGYGITVDQAVPMQLGQTGYVPGFPAMDFYFPSEKVSVVILGNKVADAENLKRTFLLHTAVLDIVRTELSGLSD